LVLRPQPLDAFSPIPEQTLLFNEQLVSKPTIISVKGRLTYLSQCCNQQYVLLLLLNALLDTKYNTYNAFLLPDTQPIIRQRDNSLHRTSLQQSSCLRGSNNVTTFSHTDWLAGFLDAGTTRCCSCACVTLRRGRLSPSSFPRLASSLHPPISKRALGHPSELACLNEPSLAGTGWTVLPLGVSRHLFLRTSSGPLMK
jgi:hypothetical protein